MKLTVGTFNIQHGKDHMRSREQGSEIIDLNLMADTVRAMGVEICGLNEVRNDERTGGVNQAKAIAEQLGWHYGFTPAIDTKNGTYGNALVSIYPIEQLRAVPITTFPEERDDGAGYENRVLLVAQINVRGTKVTVMTCHFGLNAPEMEKAVNTVLSEAKTETAPLIFMGDLNMRPDNPRIRRLAEYFTDSAEAGTGSLLTFPSHEPDRKIDYIFAKNCDVLSSEVPQLVAADHLPVRAELNL